MSLKAGRTMLQKGARAIDTNGKIFAFTRDGRPFKLLGAMSAKESCCCKFSPDNSNLLLSAGDNEFRITKLQGAPELLLSCKLEANVLSCCWMSSYEVALGLGSGELFWVIVLER
ncbi:unnamed protein product [Gongylonema pulchrum]|uniref:WD_REPEATS_REGION domain-containing protein n=1 Tax=Gongylonema pulchrum TaxID=637853 RepID=A0A183D2E7_9BILA|nr:unnamed protein product [Gongylonema pulchrum]